MNNENTMDLKTYMRMDLNSMYFLGVLALSIPIISLLLIRTALYLISWYLSRKYLIKLKVNRIGFCSLNQIVVTFVEIGVNIEIECIGLSTKLVNQKYCSLVVIKLSDIRFEGDLMCVFKSISSLHTTHSTHSTDRTDTTAPNGSLNASTNKKDCKKMPQKLINFVNLLRSLSRLRFISLCLHNTSLMQLGLINADIVDECLFHSTIHMIQLYLTTVRSNRLTLITNFEGISLKLLKHMKKENGETCLAQVSLSLSWSLRLEENHQISTEVVVSQPQLILYDILPLIKSRKAKHMSIIANNSEGLVEKLLKNKLNYRFVKCATIKCDNTSLKLVRDSGQKALAININSIEADLTKTSRSEFEARLIVSSLTMNDTKAMVSSLNRINLIAKFEREKSIQQRLQLFVVSELSSCHIVYNDEEISYWIQLFLKSYEANRDSVRSDSIQTNPRSNPFLKDLPKFSASLDISDISFSVKPISAISPMAVTYGLSHAKFGYVLNSDPLFREMSFELLLETFWCWNGDRDLRPANPNSLKKYHQKHVPLFTSMLFLKCRHMNLSEFRVHCVMDGIQISLDYFVRLLNQYDLKRYSRSESSLNSHLFSSSIQINLSSVNLFTSDLMLRIDSATTDSNTSKLTSSINGLAVSTMYAPSATLSCLRAAELTQHRIVYFSVVRLNLNNESHETTISLTEEVFIQWNPSFHLTLIELYDEFLSKLFKTNSAVESLSFTSINVKLDGKISIGALLTNSGNTMSFETEYLSFSIHSSNKISSKCEYLSLYFDFKNIMTLENISINQLPESDSQSINIRKKFVNPSLETKRNKTIAVTIECLSIKFPFDYNFAEIFNEKLITIVKWLRQLHKSESNESQSSKTSLFPDIQLSVQSASMEVGDDPFEVQLSDNYELLEDEYNESLKRWQMLSEKIEERRRKNILLPASKLEELHNAFAKQNAKTYIERSKKLYTEDSPKRTRLFSVRIEGLELIFVSDLSYNTYEKMVNILKRIDSESPFPEDIRFNTIWCRRAIGSIISGTVSLRDFPHPMTEAKNLSFDGTVLGAEQEASHRAKRTCFIDIGSNFEPISIERSMTTMKIYHDLEFKVEHLAYTHGSCWEPVLQQLSIAFESIFKPSLDPSPSLSWWDKMRFLFHGSLVIVSDQLSILFHASLDPYNSTELIEIGLNKSRLDWLTGKIIMRGSLDLLVHTASKYDECRIVHLPNVSVYISLNWLCFGHKNDHHSVMPCAPNKVPEYSSNQVHDSYRSFRSHNLNVSATLETKGMASGSETDIPNVSIYNSTLRWIENKLFMITGIPRLTRRGKLFGNVKPRKVPFGRAFKSIRVTIYLHKFKISYWSSFSKQRGFEIISSNLTHSAEHLQSFMPINDDLKHRPKPVWDLLYMNSELSEVEMWLFKGTGVETSLLDSDSIWSGERQYFLSVKKVSYNRETKSPSNVRDVDSEAPTHRLVVHDLRGAWTKDNRDVAFGLFDSYMKTQLLKRNLSTDALRAFKVDGQSGGSPNKKKGSQPSVTTSPASTISKGHAAHMLQKLIAEAENSNVVYTEDIENKVPTENSQLYGVEACQTNDVLQHNWLIELINSQVVLRGCETDGYVIVSAAKTQILQRIHRPVWKNRTLYSKTTWQGLIECMQYYATVDEGGLGSGVQTDDITWLTVDNIEERNNRDIVELPDLVGSGQSVGGVVSSEVGTCSPSEMRGGATPIQLQRIVSRCNCQFFYASFGENVDASEFEEVPPLPQDNDLLMLEPWDREIAVDTFTLTHHDLEISTNSQQFSMIMDLVNNLLLYVEPHRKEVFEKQQSIRFGMQLSSIEDQREPISQLQDKVRALVAEIKRIEKESYAIHRALAEERGSGSQIEQKLVADSQQIEFEMDECKEQLNVASEDLTVMINCFKEAQLSASKTKERQVAAQEAGGFVFANVIRRSEVCFKHAVWRLTDADGQLGLADLVLSNFLYTKVSKNDDSVEHSFELGFIHVSNLLPNQVYKDVIQLTELQPNIPLDRQIALRIFCRERAPVGGISVKEHLEVNVIPLTLGLTYAFFKNMLKFFFPDRVSEPTHSSETNDESEHQIKSNKKKSHLKRDESNQSISSNGTVSVISSSTGKSLGGQSATTSTLQMTKDNLHIEKMRERAQKNQTFVYIKIPEVPIRISYKGNKGKNLEDLHNVSLILPTMEYHNRTWTWLDLFMALKNDSKRVLLSQALKHKFHISTKAKSLPIESEANKALTQIQPQEEDEDKARMLLGNIAVPNATKSAKSSKGLSLFSHKK